MPPITPENREVARKLIKKYELDPAEELKIAEMIAQEIAQGIADCDIRQFVDDFLKLRRREKMSLGHLIATGLLNWYADEQDSGRFGYLTLVGRGEVLSKAIAIGYDPQLNIEGLEGKPGKLIAKVVDNQKSFIGHPPWPEWRGVKPPEAKVGEIIELGEGKFSTIFDKQFNITKIGLIPFDNREKDWLDYRGLYRCHEITVEIYFQELQQVSSGAAMEG